MAEFIEKRENAEENSGLNWKDLWTIVVLHWPWIVLCVILSLGLAFAYLRYTHPVYVASMKLLVKWPLMSGTVSMYTS